MSVKQAKDVILEVVKSGDISPREAVEAFAKVAPASNAFKTRRTFVPKDREARKSQYSTDRELRRRAMQSSIPFISRDFSADFKLSQGLVLVGAMSGQSKSTTAANVVAGFLNATDDTKAIVITNEETGESTYNRIACVLLQKRFIDLQKGRMRPDDLQEIEDQAYLLMDRVEVVAGDKDYDMTCLEDVQAALEYAAKSGFGLVVLDYLQTVSHSKDNQHWEPFQVSKHFGFFLKDYGRRAPVPVVVFAQLKPKSEASDMQSRIQNDKTIYNHAFSVIEIIPDFDTSCTTFVIHKDRFGYAQGKEITMQFVDGRFEAMGGGGI